ncbi:MAG: lysophospholipase [Candidatus Aminicenantes bacterium]|nr:lysophospholipase [Candidatus Aminicenantes bacterium]NLH76302.1 alpha/beta hydrolase [Acidobacteriota bacterium]
MQELQGTDFLYRRWDAEPSPDSAKAVFLLVHGLGGYSARWDFLASDLARRGFASYAVELRGFGRTPERPRGHVDSFGVWYRDILALRETALRDLPGRKVFLLGESMGGLIAYDLAGAHPEAFAGLVLIAPAFKNGMKFPLSAYLKLGLFGLFAPKMTVDVPFTSDMVTRDADYLRTMDASPDEIRVASLRLLGAFLPVQARAGRVARRLTVPVLFLVPGDDRLVDERAGRRLFAKIALADKTLVEYPDMLHALSIDLGREKIFADVAAWAGPRA